MTGNRFSMIMGSFNEKRKQENTSDTQILIMARALKHWGKQTQGIKTVVDLIWDGMGDLIK